MPFLDLPYDIRYLIYSHAFPQTRQLYLHATETEPVHLPTHDSAVPVALFRTCKALHQDASEYLYNGYLFDVMGRKSDCLKHYERIQATVTKYARDTVHVRAFSNGLDSSTGCISVLVGDAKLAMLEKRQRGQPTTIEQLEEEVKWQQAALRQFRASRQRPVWQTFWVTYWAIRIIPALMLAWIGGKISSWYEVF